MDRREMSAGVANGIVKAVLVIGLLVAALVVAVAPPGWLYDILGR